MKSVKFNSRVLVASPWTLVGRGRVYPTLNFRLFIIIFDKKKFKNLVLHFYVRFCSHKKDIILHWKYKKLHCRGEPNRFSGQRDHSLPFIIKGFKNLDDLFLQVCSGGKRKKDEIGVDCLDFNKKILHTAWHPQVNTTKTKWRTTKHNGGQIKQNGGSFGAKCVKHNCVHI